MIAMKTRIETPFAKEFISYALEKEGCIQGSPEHFLKVMKHNTGFNGALTKYGLDRKGLCRRNPLIVALGDSVTAGHFEMLVRTPSDFPAFIAAGKPVEAVDERESYPEKFRSRLSDRYEATSVSVINSGIAGDTILGMEARLTRDVIVHNPDLTLINGSLNWGVECGENLLFYQSLKRIVRRIRRETDSDVILMTPNMQDLSAAPFPAGAPLEERVDMIRKVASEENVCLADTYAVWEGFVNEGHPLPELLANRMNHPTPAGHRVYAEVLMKFFE